MTRVLGVLALAGFVLSLAAHLAALSGVDVQTLVPGLWVLHLGIFVVFIPMVRQLNAAAKDDRAAPLRGLPAWVQVLAVLLLAYVAVNFVIFIGSTLEGAPAVRDGAYVLQNRGRIIRVISKADYVARRAAEARGFSGHWLLFYFLPLAHFMMRRAPGASSTDLRA